MIEKELPLVLGEVLAVFHPVALAGDGGEPRLGETSLVQWRKLEVHSAGGGLDGVNLKGARRLRRACPERNGCLERSRMGRRGEGSAVSGVMGGKCGSSGVT